jgi:hypothetical protein
MALRSLWSRSLYPVRKSDHRLQWSDSKLAAAIGSEWKGLLTLAIYVAAAALAFVSPWIAIALYVLVALSWFIPDRRIEAVL